MKTNTEPRTNLTSGVIPSAPIPGASPLGKDATLPPIYSIEEILTRYETETSLLKEILARHFDTHSFTTLDLHAGK